MNNNLSLMSFDKGLLTCGIFLLFSLHLFSTEPIKKSSISLHIERGISEYNPSNKILDLSRDQNNFYKLSALNIGIEYNKTKDKRSDIGIGLYINTMDFSYTSNSNSYIRNDQTDRISNFIIPFQYKYFIDNTFFFSTDLAASYSPYIGSSLGIGCGFGFGLEIIFANGLDITIAPKKSWNFLLTSSNMLSNLVFNAGIGYRF